MSTLPTLAAAYTEVRFLRPLAHVGRRLLVLLPVLMLGACASLRTEPADTWAITPPQAAPAPAAAPVVAETLPAVVEPEAPPAEAGDLLDRIRAGYQLPEASNVAIDRELAWYARNPEYLDRTLSRGERYLHYIANEIQKRNMPMELALLPIVESAFNPYGYSGGRAAGLWQFISPTAVRYGIRQNWWQDGRRDVMQSTQGALDYLSALHDMFDDWYLAVAAYNCGESAVKRAVQRNRAAGLPTDFFHLQLPRETRAYVPKLLAISRLVKNPGDYGIELPVIPDEPYFVKVDTGGQIDLRVAAQLADVPPDELHALNPAFNRWATDPAGPHHLLVPVESAESFNTGLQALTELQRLPTEKHVVKPGENVTVIARDRGISALAIQHLNGMPTSHPQVGDEILVPASSIAPLRAGLVIEGENDPRSSRRATRYYTVRSGDSMWSIAHRHKVSVKSLAAWNKISPRAMLRPGQRLAVKSGSSGPARVAVQSTGFSSEAVKTIKKSASGGQVAYRVKRGDTLYEISRRFQVSVADLRRWNSLEGTSLKAGQRLVIRVDNNREYGG